jgi:hypothetical protein
VGVGGNLTIRRVKVHRSEETNIQTKNPWIQKMKNIHFTRNLPEAVTLDPLT